MAQYFSESWTPNRWRKHQKEQSDRRKAINLARTIPTRGLKWCPKCARYKRRTGFHLSMRQPDGLHQYCKPCNSALWNATPMRRVAAGPGRPRKFRWEDARRMYVRGVPVSKIASICEVTPSAVYYAMKKAA